jgi:hypothetical protein
MNARKLLALPAEYALVLQQIKEHGQEDFANLAESLQIARPRLAHIIEALKHKGLVAITQQYNDVSIRLSSKGQRVTRYIWPELTSGAA